jgi:hypothetical protein
MRGVLPARIANSVGMPGWCRVRGEDRTARLALAAHAGTESRSSLSNTAIASRKLRRRRGCSGCTQATRPVFEQSFWDIVDLSPSPSRGQQHLFAYLPPSKYGSVRAASCLVEDEDMIAVEPIRDAAAQALPHKKLGDEVDKYGMSRLAAALESMPLALVQAAAYIRNLAPGYSVLKNLEEFRKSERRNTRPSAANLLSLISFFDPQGISKALLYNRDVIKENHSRSAADIESDKESDEDDSMSEASIEDGFREDTVTLRGYSFITATVGGTFEMHNLVQLATRKWLESQGGSERWRHQFVAKLCTAFPSGRYENWKTCQDLFPHTRAASTQQPKDCEARKKWALLLYNAAWYAWQKRSAGETEERATLLMKARTKLFEAKSDEMLLSKEIVGLT